MRCMVQAMALPFYYVYNVESGSGLIAHHGENSDSSERRYEINPDRGSLGEADSVIGR